MRDLIIYGAGGLGRDVAELVRRINDLHRIWNFLGFIDDNSNATSVWGGKGVLGGFDFIVNLDKTIDVVLAIADPASKRKIYENLKRISHVHFPVLIDRDVEIASAVPIGEGSIVFHFCSVSVNSSIGNCVLVSTGTNIGHDAILGDFCSIMPSVNISGNVTLGTETFIGVGSSIIQGKTTGCRSVIGMGSIVLNDVGNYCTVFGNPAK